MKTVVVKRGGHYQVVPVELTPDEVVQRGVDEAKHAQKLADAEARKQARKDAMADIPANVNSVPELRAEVNNIKAFLREEFGIED